MWSGGGWRTPCWRVMWSGGGWPDHSSSGGGWPDHNWSGGGVEVEGQIIAGG